MRVYADVSSSNLALHFCLFVISFSNTESTKVKVKSLSRVRLFATLWTVAYQAPLSMGFSRQEYSSVHGIFQARVLEWIAISYFRGSSQSRNLTHVSCIFFIGRQILDLCTTCKAHTMFNVTKISSYFLPHFTGKQTYAFTVIHCI